MPLLDRKNLPKSPAPRAVKVIQERLKTAQGLITLLNKSVEMGVDSMLKDSIDGRMLESMMPCGRMVAQTSAYRLVSNAGGALSALVPISIYFFYYVGKPAASVLPVEFTTLRDDHIRWNIEYLKDKAVLPYSSIGLTPQDHQDDQGKRFWEWPDGEQIVEVTHDVTFDVMGLAIPVQDGFTCSRVDFKIIVLNHASFNDDPTIT